MKYFLFPLITGLILMAIINLTVDIGGTWHGPDYTFTANWDKDHYWVLPLRTEERSLRTKQIGFLPKIDTVGLGSSRFWNMDTTMFPPGTRFYNASVSGATVWDYIALWEKFKQDGNIPKNLIIYLDTWNFNKNTWLKYRWLPNAPLVFAFMHENASREMQATALLEWLTGSFYQAVDLINPTVLKPTSSPTKPTAPRACPPGNTTAAISTPTIRSSPKPCPKSPPSAATSASAP